MKKIKRQDLTINGDIAPIKITKEQVMALIGASCSAKMKNAQCFDEMFIETGTFTYNTTTGKPVTSVDITITTLATNKENDKLSQKCNRHKCGDADTPCAKKLANGKCCDEFMRNVIGAILYPNFYKKTK